MRTELQAKFLQHLNNRKKDDKGFTLVELLVVIIIIGILAAIALPNFLSQGAKAKQTEAKQNIGLVNRVQTAYRSENSSFATSFDILATGTLSGTLDATTTNYTYKLTPTQDSNTITASSTSDTALKAYSGGTVRFTNAQKQSVVSSLICEAVTPGTAAASAPDIDTSKTTTTEAISCVSATYKAL
jgi:type IV pilus assembly protein PilA